MYKIVSDSSCDIFLLDGINFKSVPLKIIADKREFSDIEGADTGEMVSYLNEFKGKSGSSCPSAADWLDSFKGDEDIFAITITSGLSGSFNSALTAKNMFLSENPERRVEIIDSLSAGPELTLIIEKLREYIIAGESFDKICENIKEYREKTGLFFMLESLKNLANNGRVSHTVAALTNILGIRLIGKASDEGTLEPISKARGEKKAVTTLFKSMLESGYKGGKVIISHCFNKEAAVMLKEKICSIFLNADVKIQKTGILCSFYAQQGGMLVGYEK